MTESGSCRIETIDYRGIQAVEEMRTMMCNRNCGDDEIEEDRNGADARKHWQTEEESKEAGNRRLPTLQDSMMRRGPEKVLDWCSLKD